MIRALVTLKCGCRYQCIDREVIDNPLPEGKDNQINLSCKGCVSLCSDRIEIFNPTIILSPDSTKRQFVAPVI